MRAVMHPDGAIFLGGYHQVLDADGLHAARRTFNGETRAAACHAQDLKRQGGHDCVGDRSHQRDTPDDAPFDVGAQDRVTENRFFQFRHIG